jgi:hypothetical protein
VKQRGFAAEPFQVSCDDEYKMRYLGSKTAVKISKIGKAEAALEKLLRDDEKMGLNKLQKRMQEQGCGKATDWIKENRPRILGKINGTGCETSEGDGGGDSGPE